MVYSNIISFGLPVLYFNGTRLLPVAVVVVVVSEKS